MTQTVIQKAFAPFKKWLPAWLWNPIRSFATAFFTPVFFSYRTGHFRSSFRRAAVSRTGAPLPWYTYPAIDFLKFRNYAGKAVLEFGGGQSTRWWAQRARQVVALEGDRDWYEKIRTGMPDNVDLCLVSMENAPANVAEVRAALAARPQATYDVIIIDGLYRYEMIAIARERLAQDGLLICDNADGYGFHEGLMDSGLRRVDFFGHAPGVVLPHCTSIYFNPASFAFDPRLPIPVISKED